MLELDKKVFGRITTKEIIGANPPILDIRNALQRELTVLLVGLKSWSKADLEGLLEQQETLARHVNSRPGAMALAQDKIRLFNEYSEKYIQAIKRML